MKQSVLLAVLISLVIPLSAQTARLPSSPVVPVAPVVTPDPVVTESVSPVIGTVDPGIQDLPDGYRAFLLGMSLAEVKSALSKDSLFDYRGDPDVSLVPRSTQTVIEVLGTSYIRRGIFQFYENKLYIIILEMDTRKMDHYSLFRSLSGKYGPPPVMDPEKSQWENDRIILALERPLQVKYVLRSVFESLKDKSKAQEAFSDITREKFLNDF